MKEKKKKEKRTAVIENQNNLFMCIVYKSTCNWHTGVLFPMLDVKLTESSNQYRTDACYLRISIKLTLRIIEGNNRTQNRNEYILIPLCKWWRVYIFCVCGQRFAGTINFITTQCTQNIIYCYYFGWFRVSINLCERCIEKLENLVRCLWVYKKL